MDFSDDSKAISFLAFFKDKSVLYKLILDENYKIIERKALHETTSNASGGAMSSDGRFVAMSTNENRKSKSYAILVIDSITGVTVNRLWFGENTSAYALKFIPGTKKIVVSLYQVRTRLLIWDFETNDL